MPEAVGSDLLALRERTATFARQELARWEAELDPEAPVPQDVAARVRARSRELGLFAMTHPRDLGGSEAGELELVIVREALAAANLRLTRFVLGPSPGILARAEGELRERYLVPVLQGELRAAFAFTEPRDAEQPTSARREGSELVIRGRKSYVTGGAEADIVSVLVRVDGEGTGLSTAMVIVDRNAAGLVVEREFRSLDGSDHLSLRFDDVRVPVDHVVGEIGQGMPHALHTIGQVRLRLAAESSGLAMWTVDYTGAALRAPHRSGTPLSDREGVRLRYADLRLETYAARAMLYRTARLVAGGDEARNEVAATKVVLTETLGRVVDGAVQLVGGQALVAGHPLERLYRQVRALRFTEGASDLLRLQVARGAFDYDQGRL